MIHLAWLHKYLLSNEDKKGRWMEDGVSDSIRSLWVPGNVFWAVQRIYHFQGYIVKILAKKLDIFIIIYLDDILIYNKNPGQAHVNAVWWVFEELKKYGLFAKLKKCRFYNDKVRFLKYIMSAQEVRIEEKRINVVKNWPEPKSICDIWVFFWFCQFLSSFHSRLQ